MNEDSYIWLEQTHDETALQWVEVQNIRSTKCLESHSNFETMKNRFITILNSPDRLTSVKKRENYYYHFQAEERLWVRIPSVDFENLEPKKWEIVLDLGALAEKEKENWVWKGSIDLNGNRGLLQFSRGGSDAVVVREFDYKSKQFVHDGFYLPEAKSSVFWKDENTLYVGTDFGPNSLTQSGYPRIVKKWKRGTPLSEAWPIFEGDKENIMVYAYPYFFDDLSLEIAVRSTSFYASIVYVRKENWWIPLDIPPDTIFSHFKDQFILQLRSNWTRGEQTFKAGSILGMDARKLGENPISLLFEPHMHSHVTAVTNTKNYLILKVLENLQNRTLLFKYESGKWVQESLETPPSGTYTFVTIDDQTDLYEMHHSDYLSPKRLIRGDLGNPTKKWIQHLPDLFQTDDLEVTQHRAISKDGTQVPYTQISRKGMINQPTLLYGYGGFGISIEPAYDPLLGTAWLEKGGTYIAANIRGGSEFGIHWHQAALRENRQNAYDDFIAVAEDLIARGVTSPKQLGIQGYSNGGLLMGVMLTQRPDLWSAVLCQHPLLDMKRYHQLTAGSSWIEEFGNPDLEEVWAYIKKYSPYQNIKAGMKYPKVLFMTSTADDRVHPGHARRMAAKMIDLGNEVLFYENKDAGHSGFANGEQVAHKTALQFSFLWQALTLHGEIEAEA